MTEFDKTDHSQHKKVELLSPRFSLPGLIPCLEAGDAEHLSYFSLTQQQHTVIVIAFPLLGNLHVR